MLEAGSPVGTWRCGRGSCHAGKNCWRPGSRRPWQVGEGLVAELADRDQLAHST